MPRGVYDRSKIKKRREKARAQVAAKNGNPPAFNPTIEDVETLTPTPPKHRNGGDGRQPWGQPYETDAREFEKNSPWDELYDDAMLRLEKTPASKAIVYPFEDDRAAERAYDALVRRVSSRKGAGAVRCGVRRDPPRLYVRRGPNWKA